MEIFNTTLIKFYPKVNRIIHINLHSRFLIDYSYLLEESYMLTKINTNSTENVEFTYIDKAFLKYYWHQICKYKIKQNYNLSSK
jgi:hypothetical protein